MSGSSSMGVYRPGMGGAMGGLVAGIISGVRSQAGSEPAHTVYVVELPDGTKRWVRSEEKLAVGDCIDLLVDPRRTSATSWSLKEATVRASNACKPRGA